MSPSSADSPALPPPPVESWLPGPKPPDEGWSPKKFYFVLGFVLAFHLALIFLFGTKKQIVPRAILNVPRLQLADGANELIALGDPTLFARPNAHDAVTTFWRRMPNVKQPDFNRKESPHYLGPATADFGAAFRDYMRNNEAAGVTLNFKPAPKVSLPAAVFNNAMPQSTTLQITGDLARSRLLNPVELPSLPWTDVLGPTKVQALVDTAGNVASAVVLDTSGDTDADQAALQLARNFRFAPAPRIMFGEITFIWHTVPTNAIPATVP